MAKTSPSTDLDQTLMGEVERIIESGDEDAEQLKSLGYTQELNRNFSIWSMFALGFIITNSWLSVGGSLAVGLPQGGIPTVFFGFIFVSIGQIFTALSMGEFAHSYPTAGGQYHWVYLLAPPHVRRSLSFICAWLSIGSWFSLAASVCVLIAQGIQGLVILSQDTSPYNSYLIFGVAHAVNVYGALANVFGVSIMPLVDKLGLYFSIILFLAYLIIIPTVGGIKNSAAFVFTEFINQTGWDSSAVVFLTGIINACYGMAYIDAAAHLAEEVPHPKRNIPRAMIATVVIGFITGSIFIVVLGLCMGDVTAILTGPTGFPFFEILRISIVNPIGVFVMSLLFSLGPVFALPAIIQTIGRLVFSLARDQGLPFSKSLEWVHPKLKSPVNAQIVVAVGIAILLCLYVASTTAFNALVAASVLLGQLSIAMPSAIFLFGGDRDKMLPSRYLNWGPILSKIPHAISVLIALIYLIFFILPFSLPATASNMNYTSVVLIAVFVLMGLDWIAVHKTFRGPGGSDLAKM
ncbi:amino acid/polyamine transporter I [Cladochytrium replicatum]|nr:amino acid/polyamine transporter I [Cladochytrium replicatum]